MEPINKVRINEIMQEKVDNPVVLTTDFVRSRGFREDWAELDWYHWGHDNEFLLLSQEGIYPPDEPFVFSFGKEDAIESVTLQFEHQLNRIMEWYGS